jgi:hypothetical protein
MVLNQRLEDLSVYYFIQNLYSSTPFVHVVDGFPVEGLEIPTIAVEAKTINGIPFELGASKRLQIRAWYIDVFAQNKSQRDDYAYTILNALEECIPVYDYDEGFPPTVVTQLGCLEVQDLRLDIIRVMPQLVDSLYWRATISFTATFNQF